MVKLFKRLTVKEVGMIIISILFTDERNSYF